MAILVFWFVLMPIFSPWAEMCLSQVSKDAILAANYLRSQLADRFYCAV